MKNKKMYICRAKAEICPEECFHKHKHTKTNMCEPLYFCEAKKLTTHCKVYEKK